MVQKPGIYMRESLRLFDCLALGEKCIESEEAPVGRFFDLFGKILHGFRRIFDAGRSDIEHPDPLLQSLWERPADGHHFSHAFHLGSDRPVCRFEFLDIPAWNFDDDVIESRLEESGGLFGDRVGNLIQPIAEGEFRCDERERIARRFRSQGAGAGKACVHFDDADFARLRIQGELNIAFSLDLEMTRRLERNSAQ